MFSKVLMYSAVAISATNAFQEKNFGAKNNQCGGKCCAGFDSDMDDMDATDVPDSLKAFADEFDNGTCGMFCQMQGMVNDTLSSVGSAMNSTMGSSCQDDCCKMPAPACEDACCKMPPPASANNGMCGSTCCAPPTTMSSSAKQDALPENFEFEQCDMMCQLNNTISGFASKAWNGNATDAMAAGSDSSDSDL
jgi:hypothetical protein